MANSVTEYICEAAIKHGGSQGPEFAGRFTREMIAAKKYDPARDLNLTHLAEGCFGRAWESRLKRVSAGAEWVSEAPEAVDLSAFRGIVGTNVSKVMEDVYTETTSVVNELVGTWPSEDDDPDQELKIPYPGIATDKSRDVAPGTEYPRTGFSPWYIKAPMADKHGLIGVLTLELVRRNKARQFLDAMKEVARVVSLEEVKRKWRLVLGITQNYNRNGTTYGTYLTSGDRVNKFTDLNLANGPSEIDRFLQLFENMVHPITGEPMDIEPTTLLTSVGNSYALNRATGVQEVRITTGSVQTIGANPLDWTGPVKADKRVKLMLDAEGGLSATEAASWVGMGDYPRAFKWREHEAFHTFEVGPNDESWPPHFFADICYACKARFWGSGFVADPFAVAAAYDAD